MTPKECPKCQDIEKELAKARWLLSRSFASVRRLSDEAHRQSTKGYELTRDIQHFLGVDARKIELDAVPHPEAICERCSGPNITWFAPSELWNQAITGTYYDILCPVCFVQLAEQVGIRATSWQVAPE